MEDRVGKPHGAEISKKSRSLDLKSVYMSEDLKEAQNKNLKRKESNALDGSEEKRHEKKKSRKEVSISSLKNVNSKGSKSLEEVYNGSLSPGSHDSKDSKTELRHRVQDGCRFRGIILALETGVLKVPRRKRGTVGRRKVENGSQVSKPAAQSNGEVGGETDQIGKSIGEDTKKEMDSSAGKRKNSSGDSKENRNGELMSCRLLEDGDGCADHSVPNNIDLSLQKSFSGDSVENDGASSPKKSLRKRSRKRKDLEHHGKSIKKELEPSIDSSAKVNDHSHDDDEEENLEENAARMLSSRFDPKCTGFSSNSKSSSLPSLNGLPVLSSSEQDHHGSNSDSESASAARVLRPRKQHNEKGQSRKRRHFYEILNRELDADWVLNRRIKVFWPLDQRWYYGLVSNYDKNKGLHHVKYDDRDEEWINLQSERFKLLLLPSEVPGKAQRKRTGRREKQGDEGKRELKPKKESKEKYTTEDDSYAGNYMDSEPIISWLARSTRRVKSSPFHASKKQKTSGSSPKDAWPSVTEESSDRCDHLDGRSMIGDKGKLTSNLTLPDRLAATGRSEVSTTESHTCSDGSKLPIVYYRRRFHKTNSVSHESCSNNVSTDLPRPDTSISTIPVNSVALEEDEVLGHKDRDNGFEALNIIDALWSVDDAGLLRIDISFMESRNFTFELSLPVFSVLNYPFGTENVWLFHAVLLLRYGTLMNIWPRVHLEMLFVDSMVGLRFLLFEGYLKQAITVVFLILTVFHKLDQEGKHAELQVPVTSIRFKFCIHDVRKQLVFAFYNFSEMKDSHWLHLDDILKKHCLLTWKLPVSECTYNNIKALQNGTNNLHNSSICQDSTLVEAWRRRRSRQSANFIGGSRESAHVNASCSSNSDKNFRCFPPFTLSFTAAPTFFQGLHLKMLMERSVNHISSCDHDLVDRPQKSVSLVVGDFSSVEVFSKKGSENNHNNCVRASSRDADFDGCSSHAKTETSTVDVSVCSDEYRAKSSSECLNGYAMSSSSIGDRKLGNDGILLLQKSESKQLESEQCDSLLKPSVHKDKPDGRSDSPTHGITVQIPVFNQFEKTVDKESNGAQQSSDFSWNMNGGIIPSPNPTARRSTWHRNRSASASFRWSDGRTDFLQHSFGNGPKKPRTRVSYALPFGVFDYSPKSKAHQQKGYQKRIRTPNEKRSFDVSRGSERNVEELSCDANLLITLGDRGQRESNAQIVLELFDHNEWKLAVKLAGTTKYSYKAHLFLQNWSTNKYTHAMIWKGGKDWMLEFPDRNQWALFKEMHEECYNRNIRAASVKNIPIPGVRLIEENDDIGAESTYFRSSSKYYRQAETDVEMALNPSRVLYDMDSDDEQWLLTYQNSSEIVNNCLSEISEEMFENTVDRLEQAAYSQHLEQFTRDEIEVLMAGVGPIDAILAIYEYWQQKRHKKGMPLIRHLQPPLWETYQQEVKEWELALSKSNIAIPSGCHGKVAPSEKPPMFAFCLKPRGLEVPNKGSKHRSQKRISVSAHSNTFSGDHEGRRLNGFASGDEKIMHPGYFYESLDDSRFPQMSPSVFSPRGAGITGYFSVNGDRNNLNKLQRSKSKKFGAFASPNDAQIVTSYNKRVVGHRNGVHRWNMGLSDWPSQRHYHLDGTLRHSPEQLDGADLEEFRLLDASGAAQHARNIAKFKREKAQRLLYRADVAIHKAVVALMTADAMKASAEDVNGVG